MKTVAPFTSGLTIPEWAIACDLGMRPLAQVMGTTVVQVGRQYLMEGWGGERVMCELDVVIAAWEMARRNARDRLAEEAQTIGADAVVAVRTSYAEHRWAENSIDYALLGTAVRFAGSDGSSWPILTSLSLQDYWMLIGAGHTAIGLVAATSVVFTSPARNVRWQRMVTATRNQELPELNEALTLARTGTMRRIEAQATTDRSAMGVVGLTLDQKLHEANYEAVSNRTYARLQSGLQAGSAATDGPSRNGFLAVVHAVGSAIAPLQPNCTIHPPELTNSLGAPA